MNLLNSPEAIAELTRKSTFERFADGRPRVPDAILERMKAVTTEEAWGVCRRNGYQFQFAGNWLNLHPDHVLVGRAVTAMFVPKRPDLDELVEEWGASTGRSAAKQNSWVIDTLVEGDVIVVDLFGKVKYGTFAGDNLSTAIHSRSHTGMVIEGGIRDVQRIYEIQNFGVFVRGVDPTAIADVTLAGINVPIRIGEATVLPGDIVLGTREGVIFIPAHLAELVVERSENIRLRDQFGQMRLREGTYGPADIDRADWPAHIEEDYQNWRKTR